MFLFNEVGQHALAALQNGQNVRLTGKRLGGRSTVLNAVTDSLMASSVQVAFVRGDLASREHPGYGIEQMRADLGFQLRARDAYSAVEGIASALGPDSVVAVDDAHLIDPFTLRVLSAVHKRVGMRFVSTELIGRSQDRNFPGVWPERLIRVPDLNLPLTTGVLHNVLDGPVDPLLAARLYGKSGGVVGILIAVAEGTRDNGLLEFINGAWRGHDKPLWSPSIAALLDGLIAELEPDEQNLIRWLAEHGPLPATSLAQSHGEQVVQRALELHYVTPAGSDRSTLIQVWPPLLATRFQETRRIVYSDDRAESSEEGAKFAGSTAGPGASNELTLLAHSFIDHEAAGMERARADWSSSHTTAHAAKYLTFALGVAAERSYVTRVFSETEIPSGRTDPGDLDFLFRRAVWLIFEEKSPDAARKLFDETAAAHPEWTPSIRAVLSVFLVMSGEAVPRDYPMQTDPPSGTIYLVSIFLALVAGDVSELDRQLHKAVELPELAWLQDYMLPRIAYLRGSVTEALALALQKRTLARERFDRSAYVVLTYVAILAAHHLGDNALIRQLLSEATVIGRPRPALDAFYGAVFVMGAMDAQFSGQPQIREDMLLEAASVSPQIGPFLGMGLDFPTAILESGADANRFDVLMSEAVALRLERGFVIGAVQTAVTALTISWGERTADQLAHAYGDLDLPLFANAVALCKLLRTRDIDAVEEWARSVRVGDDLNLLVRITESAARRATESGEPALSAALIRISAEYIGEPPPYGGMALTDPIEKPEAVTKRERQVGMLAGQLTSPEIAERLGLSKRTVENHISNALRKTGATNRSELASALIASSTP